MFARVITQERSTKVDQWNRIQYAQKSLEQGVLVAELVVWVLAWSVAGTAGSPLVLTFRVV